MKLSEELTARGFVYQCTGDDVSEVLDGEKRTVYLGIDPTASSIHVGNLVPYMLLNHLMRAGHKVILLMGGGTALIGDPGGKSEERPFVEPEVIAQQTKEMEADISRFVDAEIIFENNHNWLSELTLIDFLRDVGKHFTVNAMIKKDIVVNRLSDDTYISFTEFSYSLLQAYDYYHLHKEYNCDLQIGGSDQWSNILAGVEYIRKTTGNEVHALTIPLVVDKTTGKKFGKSEGNAIWLNPEQTSPYQFYQFWLNTSDENVIEYLKLFTFLSLDEIDDIKRSYEQDPGAREAQKKLAYEVTKFVHTQAVADSVVKVSEIIFGSGDVGSLSTEEKQILLDNAPIYEVDKEQDLVDVLVYTKLATSKREARTFIESGAITLNGKRVDTTELPVSPQAGEMMSLRRGKKQFVMLYKR